MITKKRRKEETKSAIRTKKRGLNIIPAKICPNNNFEVQQALRRKLSQNHKNTTELTNLRKKYDKLNPERNS